MSTLRGYILIASLLLLSQSGNGIDTSTAIMYVDSTDDATSIPLTTINLQDATSVQRIQTSSVTYATATPVSSPTANVTTSASGLSTAVIAGVAVGVVVGIAAVAGITVAVVVIIIKVVKPGGSKIVPIKKSDTEKDAGKQSLMDTLPKAE